MENASKALIIAGAILLAILIIGLGIYIYNQASNSVSDTGMDKMAVRQFNGQFEPYLDKNLSSVEAKALIDTMKSANIPFTEGSQVTAKTGDKGVNDDQCTATATYVGDANTTKIKSIAITKVTGGSTNTGE